MSWSDGIQSETVNWSEQFEIFVSAFGDESIAVFDDNSYTAYSNGIIGDVGRTDSLESESGTWDTDL